MQELVKRLAALDPAAAEELRVVEHFDALIEARAGLEAFVRAAAVMAGCPAGLSDPSRRFNVRVLASGERQSGTPSGLIQPLRSGEPAVVWLERAPETSRQTDVMILERFAAGVRVVLDRTRRVLSADPASIELLLDREVASPERREAAERLGLASTGEFFVVASTTREAVSPDFAVEVGGLTLAICVGRPLTGGFPGRVGVGTAGELEHLPTSRTEAVLSLRLTGLGTLADPGQMQIYADNLGGLIALGGIADHPSVRQDIARVNSLAAEHPWALQTLYALTTETSLRAAAAALSIHHSTLQSRIAAAEQHLGYSLQGPLGRTRVHVALWADRLTRPRN